MGTYATSADVAASHALYLVLITKMTYDSSASVLAIWKQEATNALNRWADAMLALQNVSASSASSYSSAVGNSYAKKTPDEIRQQAAVDWDSFVLMCARGGVTVPTIDESSVSYWDLSGRETCDVVTES